MSRPSSPPGVASEAELAFHDRYYRLGTLGRELLALLILAVGLGIVGSGPLSWSDATEGDLTVEYERFMRRGAPWTMRVDAAAPEDEVLHVVVSRPFHHTQKLTSVTPQPDSVTVSSDVVTYVFGAGTTSGRVTVDFHFTADSIGWESADVGIAGGGPRVEFRQLMYP